jgi:hypothetical protein
MNEIEQKLRDNHLALAGKIKCLQALSNLYYDLRHWLDDDILSLEEIINIVETRVSKSEEKLNSGLSYEETTGILSVLQTEHNRLRDYARERKYSKKSLNENE